VQNSSTCPECGHSNLYSSAEVSAGGGYAPNYLQGLGGFLSTPKFTVVVCKDCGLSRFFASKEARDKLSVSDKWRKIR
jgi:predicted nucleic-acid-binding Zn-ribbon protein